MGILRAVLFLLMLSRFTSFFQNTAIRTFKSPSYLRMSAEMSATRILDIERDLNWVNMHVGQKQLDPKMTLIMG